MRGSISFWSFGGSAVVTDDYVRLTPAEKSRTGWIWNSKVKQYTYTDARSFLMNQLGKKQQKIAGSRIQ